MYIWAAVLRERRQLHQSWTSGWQALFQPMNRLDSWLYSQQPNYPFNPSSCRWHKASHKFWLGSTLVCLLVFDPSLSLLLDSGFGFPFGSVSWFLDYAWFCSCILPWELSCESSNSASDSQTLTLAYVLNSAPGFPAGSGNLAPKPWLGPWLLLSFCELNSNPDQLQLSSLHQ